jgi:hypothetical protein
MYISLRNAGYDDFFIIQMWPKMVQELAKMKKPVQVSRERSPQINITNDINLIRNMLKGDPVATAKVNANLRDSGKNDAEIIAEIGFKNFMPEREVKKHLTTPALDVVPKVYKKEFPETEIIEKLEPYELEIAANTKPRNPAKISDRHTKGLTSEKMVNNLKHHGTVFNMADDAFNDVLNADIDDDLVVSENDLMQIGDFEDEID